MFNIDIRSTVPIYEQLVQQVKRSVVQGLLKPGDALPSVRRLAADTGINPNTVAKAYRELEHQKVIITIRGKGKYEICGVIGETKKHRIRISIIHYR